MILGLNIIYIKFFDLDRGRIVGQGLVLNEN